jgi:3-phenylpropionate/trans-cinnamate dioxygenase ferredoxin subunit
VGLAWRAVLSAHAIGDDEIVGVKIDGKDVAICRQGGAYHAFHNVCTHQHALLSDGYVEDGCVECPLHQGRFDVRTGQPMGAPVTAPIQVYPVKVESGQVHVDVDGTSGTP